MEQRNNTPHNTPSSQQRTHTVYNTLTLLPPHNNALTQTHSQQCTHTVYVEQRNNALTANNALTHTHTLTHSDSVQCTHNNALTHTHNNALTHCTWSNRTTHTHTHSQPTTHSHGAHGATEQRTHKTAWCLAQSDSKPVLKPTKVKGYEEIRTTHSQSSLKQLMPGPIRAPCCLDVLLQTGASLLHRCVGLSSIGEKICRTGENE